MKKLYFENEKPKKKINIIITIISVIAVMVTGILYVSKLKPDSDPTKSAASVQQQSGM